MRLPPYLPCDGFAQVFPEHCDDNERIVAAEFAMADVDGSDGISYPEFVLYYQRLKQLYDAQEDAAAAAARKAAEKAARLASIASPLVACPGCGVEFISDAIETHQRSCEAYEMWLRKGAGAGGGGGGGKGAVDENGFVACQYCKRTFFPDRLAKHVGTCKAKHGKGDGIRSTMTDGATVTKGQYD